MKYKTKNWTINGVEVKEGMFVEKGAKIELTEVEKEVEFFINVYNCRAYPCIYLNKQDGTAVAIGVPDELIPNYIDILVRGDVYKQGSITWSGRYEILSKKIWRWLKTKKIQKWVKETIEKEGLTPQEGQISNKGNIRKVNQKGVEWYG